MISGDRASKQTPPVQQPLHRTPHNHQVCMEKAGVVARTPALLRLVGGSPADAPGHDPAAGRWLGGAYRLAPADLRSVGQVVSALGLAGLDPGAPTLVLAECVLVYLEREESDALLRQLSAMLSTAAMLVYEQVGFVGEEAGGGGRCDSLSQQEGAALGRATRASTTRDALLAASLQSGPGCGGACSSPPLHPQACTPMIPPRPTAATPTPHPHQVRPDDAFGKQMLLNLSLRGCPLLGICWDVDEQAARLRQAGWERAEAAPMDAMYR